MKNNYFPPGRKVLHGLFFLVTALAVSAFSPGDDSHRPPKKKTNNFYDPAQFVKFTVSGYSDDVIANGIGDLAATTTNDVDGANYCYLQMGTQINSSSTPTTYGLPANGLLTSPDITDLTYQLADYNANNSLRIATAGVAGEASVTFAETGMYEALYLAVVSGSGSCTISGTINFSDSSTQSFSTLTVPDWYNSTALPRIIIGIGRGKRTDNTLESGNASNPRIYQLTLAVDAANQGKTVTGITVQKSGTGIFNLFAVSGKKTETCIGPSGLAASGITNGSANVSWTGAGNIGETFEYAYVTSGSAIPVSGTPTSSTSATLSGLASNTTYNLYVRTNCGGGSYSYWEGPYSFHTLCDPVGSVSQNFEGGTLPDCWAVINGGDSNTWAAYSSTTYAHGGSYSMRIAYSSSAHNDYLITPGFTVTDHVSDIISFWARNYSTTYVDRFDVLVSTTGTATTDFTNILATNIGPGTSYSQYTYDLSAYVGQTIYFAIKATSTNMYYLYVDDVVTSGTPYCLVPTNAAVTGITPYEGTLTWDVGTNTAWEVAYALATDPVPSSGTPVTTNTYNFTGLGQETSYVAYVRSNCGSDGYSDWATVSFQTAEACADLTGVASSGITTSEATLTWDMGAATAWEATYVLAGDAAPTSGTPITTNTILFDNLASGTTYTAYVRANCGSEGYGDWSTLNFTTVCGTYAALDEDFESTSLPNCWAIINGGDTNTWTVYNSTTYAHSGSYSMRIAYTSSTAHSDYLITPAFTVTDHVSDMISFWARNYSNSFIDRFDVLVSTTGTAEADFTDVLASNVGPSTTYTQYTYDLSAYVGQTVYFAIKAISIDQWYLYVDDVVTSGTPYCLVPDNVAASGVTTTDATITWDMGTNTAWEFAYTLTGEAAPTSGTPVTTNTYQLGNLTANTDYTVYVRSNCGSNGYSEWVTVDFTTPCDAMAGISEDFEGTALPDCWTVINGGDTNTWFLYDNATYAHSGTKSMRISYTSSAAHNDYLITPAFTVTPHVSDMISFWAVNYSASWVDEFNVLVSTIGNQEADFTEVLATNVAPGTTYTQYSYDLTAYNGQTIYFAIKAISQDEYHLDIDDVMTSGIPECDAPTNVAVTGVNATDATVTWDAGTGTTWEVAYVLNGEAAPTSGTEVTTTTLLLDNLTPSTDYTVYVKSDCGSYESDWVTVNFTTSCEIAAGINESFEGGVIPDCWTVLNVDGGYTWDAYSSSSNAHTGSYSVRIHWDSGAHNDYLITPAFSVVNHVSDMISFWSKNGSPTWTDMFDVLVSTTGTNPADFTNVLATNVAPPTSYAEYTYDLSAFEGQNIYFALKAISTDQLYVYVDDFMTFGEPYCLVPENVAVDNIGAYSADVTWDAGVNTDWEVTYVLDGDPAPTSGTPVTSNSFTFDGLSPETNYTAYVRSNCGTDGYSEWVAVDFETLEACPEVTNIMVSVITTSNATVTWDMGTATSWEIAYVLEGDPEPTSGTPITTNIYTLEPLTANTQYTVYVRANCTAAGYSDWAEVDFTTPCDAVAGIDEDFEGDAIPDCWTVINGGDANTWFLYNSTTYAHSGSKSMRISYTSTAAHNDYLITPAFTVTSHVSDMISFWARNYSSTWVDQFNILVSTTGNSEADFTDVLATNVAPPTTYTQYTYDLSAYVGQTVYFAIKAISQDEYHLNVDDFMTFGTDYCDAPTALTADVSPSMSTIGWTDAAGTAWELAVQDVNAGVPSSGMAVTSTSYDVTLAAGEVKEFYVRTNCDGTNFSDWAGPFVFGGHAPLAVVSGYSDDVIANGIGAPSASTTNAVDEVNWAYLSKDFKINATDADRTFGLPNDGGISSSYEDGLNYQMASYSGDNSLRIQTTGGTGTLTFGAAYPADKLYLLVVSGSGGATFTGTIHFTDATTQTIATTDIPDWFSQTTLPIAISGIGRVNLSTEVIENPSGNPRIYELEIDIDAANEGKTIASIDVVKTDTDSGVINIFAASLKFSTQAFAVDAVKATSISVYPNPVKDNLYVTGVEAETVEVINMLGQRVLVVNNTNTINMTDLQKGVYLVNIYSANGNSTVRVIKN